MHAPENQSTKMTPQLRDRRIGTALWLIVVLLAVIATSLLMRPAGGFSLLQRAYGESQMAGARGIYAFIGPLDKNRTGLWMMDVDAGNVWVYEYLASTRKLRLAAARSFVFDRYLEDWNCDEPTLEEVKLMLDRARRSKNRISGVAGSDANDESGLGIHVPTDPLDVDGKAEKREDQP